MLNKRTVLTNQFLKSMLDNGGNFFTIWENGTVIGYAHTFTEITKLIDSRGYDLEIHINRRMDSYALGYFPVKNGNVIEPEYGADFIDCRWGRLSNKYAA